MRYLSIKNLNKHQHYKDRRPPWIKLHVAMLDDYGFSCLQDASKAHLMLLWVLASQMDNRIPYDLAFISRKLGTTSPVDVEELVLQGFIELSHDDSALLAPRKQMTIAETEAETERKTEAETKISSRSAPRSLTEDERSVVRHYLTTHPRRKIDDKLARKFITPALQQFSVAELCLAINGNAEDPWCRDKHKHELGYVLRNADTISGFVAKADPPPRILDSHGDESLIMQAMGWTA